MNNRLNQSFTNLEYDNRYVNNDNNNNHLEFSLGIYTGKFSLESMIKDKEHNKKIDRLKQIKNQEEEYSKYNITQYQAGQESQKQTEKLNEKFKNYLDKLDELRKNEDLRDIAYLEFGKAHLDAKALQEEKENLDQRKREYIEKERIISLERAEQALFKQRKLEEEKRAAIKKFVETRKQIFDEERQRVRQRSEELKEAIKKQKPERDNIPSYENYDKNLNRLVYNPNEANGSKISSHPIVINHSSSEDQQNAITAAEFEFQKNLKKTQESFILKDEYRKKSLERGQIALNKIKSKKELDEFDAEMEKLKIALNKEKVERGKNYPNMQTKPITMLKKKKILDAKIEKAFEAQFYLPDELEVDYDDNSRYDDDDYHSKTFISNHTDYTNKHLNTSSYYSINSRKYKTLDNFYSPNHANRESTQSRGQYHQTTKGDLHSTNHHLRSNTRSQSGSQFMNHENDKDYDLSKNSIKDQSFVEERRSRPSSTIYNTQKMAREDDKSLSRAKRPRKSPDTSTMKGSIAYKDYEYSDQITPAVYPRTHDSYDQGYYSNTGESFSNSFGLYYKGDLGKEHLPGSIYPNNSVKNHHSNHSNSSLRTKSILQNTKNFSTFNYSTITSKTSGYMNDSRNFSETGKIISQKESLKNHDLTSQSRETAQFQNDSLKNSHNRTRDKKAIMEYIDPENIDLKDYIKEQEEYLKSLDLKRNLLKERHNMSLIREDNDNLKVMIVPDELSKHQQVKEWLYRKKLNQQGRKGHVEDEDEKKSKEKGNNEKENKENRNKGKKKKRNGYEDNEDKEGKEDEDEEDKENEDKEDEEEEEEVEVELKAKEMKVEKEEDESKFPRRFDDMKGFAFKENDHERRYYEAKGVLNKSREYDMDEYSMKDKEKIMLVKAGSIKRPKLVKDNYMEKGKGSKEHHGHGHEHGYEHGREHVDEEDHVFYDKHPRYEKQAYGRSSNEAKDGERHEAQYSNNKGIPREAILEETSEHIHFKRTDKKSMTIGSFTSSNGFKNSRTLMSSTGSNYNQVEKEKDKERDKEKEKGISRPLGEKSLEMYSSKARSEQDLADMSKNFMEFSFKNQSFNYGTANRESNTSLYGGTSTFIMQPKYQDEIKNKSKNKENLNEKRLNNMKKAWKMEYDITCKENGNMRNGEDCQDQTSLSLADMFKKNKKNFIEKYEQQKAYQQFKAEGSDKSSKYRQRTKEEILKQRKEMMDYHGPFSRGSRSRGRSENPEELRRIQSESQKRELSAQDDDYGFKNNTQIRGPSQELLDRLASGNKTKIEKKEMIALTQKNYELLPEIKKKKEEETRKEDFKRRQLMVKELDKKVRNNLLKTSFQK